MAGFAALIGGMAQPAHEYGQQVRGFLEARRNHYAELLSTVANNETDPQKRSAYLQGAADLYANKPMEKILPPLLKTAQDHVEGNHALAQLMGGTPAPPKQTPAPAQPGQTPGTGSAVAAITAGLSGARQSPNDKIFFNGT